MKTLYMYSTSACHLCELAQEIISAELGNYQLDLQVIDISESNELMERYGVRIPVLKLNGRELGWPFDNGELLVFFNQS